MRLPPPRSKSARGFNVVLIAGGLSAGPFLLGRFNRVYESKSVSAGGFLKSIGRVCRSTNLSRRMRTTRNFESGIQDEIITRLAKIADLKGDLAHLTQQYQSKPGNLSEIAKQLAWRNIPGGQRRRKVARSGTRQRSNSSRSRGFAICGADTYDRNSSTSSASRAKLPKAIAEALQAKLSGGEQTSLGGVKRETNRRL